MNNIIESLNSFGFSNLEANIYLTLVKEKKSTGYKIAKIIGKPVSNIYKALISLQKKGIILIDETKTPKECVPVPINEYLNIYENDIKKKRTDIEKQIENISINTPNEGIYKIENIEHVIEKGIELIRKAKEVIMVNLYPYPLSVFKEVLEEKAAEGIKVFAKVYYPTELKGCHIVEHTYSVEHGSLPIPINWNCDWCDIIVDDREFLIAFFEKRGKKVLQAYWSKNTYLNLTLFSGFANKFVLSMITKSIYSDKSKEEIQSDLKKYYTDYMYSFYMIDNFAKMFKELQSNEEEQVV